MIQKDRYSKAFLIMSGSALLTMYFFRIGKNNLIPISGIILIGSLTYILYLMKKKPAILHFTKKQTKNLDIEYKGEDDCGFNKEYKSEIDGLRLKGKRYKYVNGTDVCITKENNIVPCGFGSRIMQFIGDGGKEPKSIQNKECWE
ncbi:hypothetical protein JYT36_00520 [Bacteroidales bacterium AH-315-N07]|nr:hypothetical protein [Bacteroidales bacterium AH-315-N07]